MKITELPAISSKDNPRIKHARAVRDGRNADAIFVEGARLVTELIRSPLNPIAVFVSDEFYQKNADLITELSKISAADIQMVASKVFDSISDTENSQGIIALAERPQRRDFSAGATGNGLFVFLNKINNPLNLGAVTRTAEAAGVAGVITSPGSTDVYSPKAIRASMGSAFRLPIHTEVSLGEAVGIANEMDVRVIAADVNAEKSYTQADWGRPTMLVLGSEAHGLDEGELDLIDETVLIPMDNGVESLNLAVSAGIILFEAKRQRSNG